MKLLSARLNHATNSSSSHSVILAGSAAGSSENGDFGWNHFLQASRKDKMHYMATQLYGQMCHEFGEHMGATICAGLFFGDIEKIEAMIGVESGGTYGYVDHQSEITIPRDFKGSPNLAFFKELTDTLANDESAHIRGGNDNEDHPDPGTDHSRWGFLSNFRELGSNAPIARKQNGVWTLYSRGSGGKVHLSFNDENIVQETYRAETPELVDLKITDYCSFGCTYCYQDSTKQGQHASFEDLIAIGTRLAEAEVFEVAIGGGEPTQHPEFADIVDMLRLKGITPNFTTKSRDWYKNQKTVDAVWKNCASYACSIDNASHIPYFSKAHEAINTLRGGYGGPRIAFQYILDANPMERFVEVLKAIPQGGTLTLLGYKQVGRGGKIPHRNDGWLKEVRKLYPKNESWKLPRIAIDTLLANQYEEELKAEKIPEKLYYKEEGRFSMYVDAVAKKSGKSSYHPIFVDWKTPYDALKGFSTFR